MTHVLVLVHRRSTMHRTDPVLATEREEFNSVLNDYICHNDGTLWKGLS